VIDTVFTLYVCLFTIQLFSCCRAIKIRYFEMWNNQCFNFLFKFNCSVDYSGMRLKCVPIEKQENAEKLNILLFSWQSPEQYNV